MNKLQFLWYVLYMCIPIILISYIVFKSTPEWFGLPFNVFCGFLCHRMYLKVKREWKF